MMWRQKQSQPGDLALMLEGRGKLILSATDHIATGGEGSVFRKGDTAVKLYTDPAEMLRSGTPEKIKLLAGIRHPFIVAPKGLVFDKSGSAIGFWMPFAEGEALPRLFTNDFRGRVGFTDRDASTLVDRMRQAVRAAHDHGATMVDGNELNYLARLGGRGGPEPRLIDVDSWAIGRFGAKVIMPSIRDWHAQGFGPGTDWFAWAIVTFQLYAGLHPYKGTADGFGRADLEGRMRANVSVFHKGVRVNRAVRDFECIPAGLRDWYERVFEHGERTAPPSPFDPHVVARAATALRQVVTAQHGGLVLEKLLETTADPVVRVFPCGAVRLASGVIVDIASRRRIAASTTTDVDVVAKAGGWLIAENGAFRFVASDGTEARLVSPVAGTQILRAGNRLFVIGETLTEIDLKLIGRMPLLLAGRSWGVLPRATRWFDGLGVQDALGTAWLIQPFGDTSCAQVRVPELDGVVPLAGMPGNRYAQVIGRTASGTYQRFEFAFDAEYRTYRLTQQDADTVEINAAALAKGVVASIPDDGVLRIVVPTTGATRVVNDRHVTTDIALAAWNDRVVYIEAGALWGMRLA